MEGKKERVTRKEEDGRGKGDTKMEGEREGQKVERRTIEEYGHGEKGRNRTSEEGNKEGEREKAKDICGKTEETKIG